MRSAIVALIIGLLSLPAFGQEQPFVPACEVCPEFPTPPYPHSGWWHNGFQPGTGINLDVQNGVVAANLYTFKEDGSSVWYQFSGELQPADDENVYWTLEANLYDFSGGQTVDGAYSAPEPEVVGTISVDFVRRNLLQFQVDDGPVRAMSSFMFGSTATRPFLPESNILAPTFEKGDELGFEGTGDFWPWTIIQMNPEGGSVLTPDGPSRYGFSSSHTRAHWGVAGVENGGRASYEIEFLDLHGPPHVQTSAFLICGTGEQLVVVSSLPDQASDAPHLCLFWAGLGNPPGEARLYYIRIGDITDRDFIGVSEDGWIVKGFRLLYN